MWVVGCSWYAKEGCIIGERAVEMSMVGRQAEARLLAGGMLLNVVVVVGGILSRGMFMYLALSEECCCMTRTAVFPPAAMIRIAVGIR